MATAMLDKPDAGTDRRPVAITFRARIECPSCGQGFEAEWTGLDETAQRCRHGHAFEMAWPGWTPRHHSSIVADTAA